LLHVGRYKRELCEAKAANTTKQQQLAELKNLAAAELAATEAKLGEARRQLRLLEVQQSNASGASREMPTYETEAQCKMPTFSVMCFSGYLSRLA
jgi:hypothetical protein